MCVKSILILANSVKHQGRCVAGKDIATMEWVRAVSNAEGEGLAVDRCRYQNIGGIQQLRTQKVLSMNFSVASPLIHQPENHIITDAPWVQSPPFVQTNLLPYLDTPPNLWGVSNSIPYQLIQEAQLVIEQSLYLIQVNNMRLYNNAFERPRCEFEYSTLQYDLPVTDLAFNRLMGQGRGGDALLCVSLGEPYQGSCYKIVASIF